MMLQQQEQERRAAAETESRRRFDAGLAFDREQFAADEAARGQAQARQAMLDMNTLKARNTEQAQRQDQAGVRRMIVQGLQAKGMTPESAQMTAFQEGIELPAAMLPDVVGQRQIDLENLRSKNDMELAKFNASQRPSAQATPKSQEWVTRDGKLTPIAPGTAVQGDVPFDPVAARQAKPTNEAEAVDTAVEAERLATALRNHKGLSGAFGVIQSRLPTLRQDTADAEVMLKSLQGLLTLENTGKLKGVLSNADMEILRRASTTLAAEMSDDAARDELDRVAAVMRKVTSGAKAPAVPAGLETDGVEAPDWVRDAKGKLIMKGRR
jgi:hypothetical protein